MLFAVAELLVNDFPENQLPYAHVTLRSGIIGDVSVLLSSGAYDLWYTCDGQPLRRLAERKE